MIDLPQVLVIIPVFNDWVSLELLVAKLDTVLSSRSQQVNILIINDGSSREMYLPSVSRDKLIHIATVRIIDLHRNIGHQRSIALGLNYASECFPAQAIVVMDADGEDLPEDVPRLLEAANKTNFKSLIFAKRTKRSEGALFKISYSIYKLIFKILTGNSVRGGNFSLIPHSLLGRVVAVPEIWNHYAVGVTKAKAELTDIPTVRGSRIAGESKMNFVGLVIHGLSSITVYGDVVGVRLLIATCVLIAFCCSAMILAIFVKLFTSLAIPGWATYVVGFLLIILMQAVGLSFFFVFLVLGGRNALNLPRESRYRDLILKITDLLLKS